MTTTQDEVYDEPCCMCGEPIQDEDWLFDDRSVWTDEQDSPEVYIHDRCAG